MPPQAYISFCALWKSASICLISSSAGCLRFSSLPRLVLMLHLHNLWSWCISCWTARYAVHIGNSTHASHAAITSTETSTGKQIKSVTSVFIWFFNKKWNKTCKLILEATNYEYYSINWHNIFIICEKRCTVTILEIVFKIRVADLPIVN